MSLPTPISSLIAALSKLPGIGPRSAERIALHLVQSDAGSVVGSFTCTPVVRYDLDDAKDDDQVTGSSVLELGTGNTPRSMFAYEKDGKKFILINAARNDRKPAPKLNFPSGYWVAKVDHTLLKETVNVNENAPWRVGKGSASLADRVFVAKDYFGTLHMDQLDNARAIVLREADKSLKLSVLALP